MKRIFLKSCCLILLAASILSVQPSARGEDFDISSDEDETEFSPLDIPGSPDGIDPEEYYTFSFLGRSLLVALELQFSSEYMKDYELAPRDGDDLLEIEPELNTALFYEPWEKTYIYLENEVQHKLIRHTEGGSTRDQWTFERIESWILFGDIAGSGVSLQIGRQSYEDDRQWWWDAQLDSIRVHLDRNRFHTELAVARQLAPESSDADARDSEDRHSFRMLSQTVWDRDETSRYAMFLLYQNDRSGHPGENELRRSGGEATRVNLFWYGIRAAGELETAKWGNVGWWVDLGGVTGDETLFEVGEADEDGDNGIETLAREVSGRGLDTGIVWEPEKLGDMMLTIGYAWGSGDRSLGDGKNSAFRQSGFNEGDKRFQYYGELLNPDLSNLRILTFSIGFPVGNSGFLDVVYHRYDQDHPADFLWESDLEMDPEGSRSFIGEEWDVAVTFERTAHVEIESSAALFNAGDAFGDLSGETAYRLKFELNYLF